MSEDGISDETADPRFRTLSVIVPVFNERSTVAEIVRRMRSVELPVEREIVVVDDGSDDGTGAVLTQLRDSTVRVIAHPHNRGKGAAIRTGLESATGDLVLVQDADLEYDPEDWPRLLAPFAHIQSGEVTTLNNEMSTYVSVTKEGLSVLWVEGKKRAWESAFVLRYALSRDPRFRVYYAENLEDTKPPPGQADWFDFEPQFTAKMPRRGIRIYEVPISYAGRELSEGKKITWQDGFTALWTLVKYRFVD